MKNFSPPFYMSVLNLFNVYIHSEVYIYIYTVHTCMFSCEYVCICIVQYITLQNCRKHPLDGIRNEN